MFRPTTESVTAQATRSKKTAEAVEAVVKGSESQLNFKDTSDNYKIAVPKYLCPLIVLDKNNVKEVLVKGGYYTESEIESNDN